MRASSAAATPAFVFSLSPVATVRDSRYGVIKHVAEHYVPTYMVKYMVRNALWPLYAQIHGAPRLGAIYTLKYVLRNASWPFIQYNAWCGTYRGHAYVKMPGAERMVTIETLKFLCGTLREHVYANMHGAERLVDMYTQKYPVRNAP